MVGTSGGESASICGCDFKRRFKSRMNCCAFSAVPDDCKPDQCKAFSDDVGMVDEQAIVLLPSCEVMGEAPTM